MNEVDAMARAGEGMGKAVGTGLRTARTGATRASKVGLEVSRQAAALAEQELAQRGISTDDLQERLAQRATGMSRKELSKRGKKARKQWEKKAAKSRKQLAKNTETARKDLATKIDPSKGKRRRKWPWAVLVLGGLAAAAAVALSRRPEELPVGEAGDGKIQQHDTEGRHSAPAGVGAERDGHVAEKPSSLGSDQK